MIWGAEENFVSNSAAVFDTANGFQGVWHLSDATHSIVHDATANGYHGTPSPTAPIAVNGVIGGSQ